MGVIWAAALWGFAEATLFFLVPDVLLSFSALRRTRVALILSVVATVGALAGGTLMYLWGSLEPEEALAVLDQVPAVSAEMVDRVASDLDRQGLWALLFGPFRGTPYKIYAVQAGRLDVSLVAFLLVSVPARLVRFVLVSLLTGWFSESLLGSWSLRRKRWVLAIFWVLFYAGFLVLMPG